VAYDEWHGSGHCLPQETDPCLRHGLFIHGIFLYTGQMTNIPYWEIDEVIVVWPLKPYPQEVLDSMPKEKAEKVARYPLEMREWKEKRADELQDW
jgi:hypothetical protein